MPNKKTSQTKQTESSSSITTAPELPGEYMAKLPAAPNREEKKPAASHHSKSSKKQVSKKVAVTSTESSNDSQSYESSLTNDPVGNSESDLNDAATDAAVDDISHEDADTILAVVDTLHDEQLTISEEAVPKAGFGHKSLVGIRWLLLSLIAAVLIVLFA